MNITALKVNQNKKLEKTEFTIEKLQDTEVLIEILACGICHTDFFALKAPGSIPGHEIVGIIQKVGKRVTEFKIGDRVGCGWQANSCQESSCEWCFSKKEQFCSKKLGFVAAKRGGYADYVVWESRFCTLIPESLSSLNAAPLMCAGSTTYVAIKSLEGKQKVGILGIGGLGHLAIQYAHKLGHHVVAISSSKSKEQETKDLGADEFFDSSNDTLKQKYKGYFNSIVCTVSGDIDWDFVSFYTFIDLSIWDY